MTKNGGIFTGPTALGALGQVEGIPCVGKPFVKALQAELMRRGYNVRQDGVWDGCCQSALIKEVGAPIVHTDQVKQFLGKTCTTGYFETPLQPGGGLLVGSPTQTTPPNCATGADSKGSAAPVPGSSNVQSCPQGMIYDLTVGGCVPTLDPFGCGNKCMGHPMGSQKWAQCMFDCNQKGAQTAVPPWGAFPIRKKSGKVDEKRLKPPSPGLTPTTPTETSAASVLGDNLPYILGAMAVGLGAVLYFGTRKKQPSPTMKREMTVANAKLGVSRRRR